MNNKEIGIECVYEYILFKEAVNPFIKLKTKSGIVLVPGFAQSKETGEIEELDQIIGFGLVEVVGDMCTRVKVGDGIFYDRRSVRAVPLDETLWQYSERNVVALIRKDSEVLQKAYAEYYKMQAEIEAAQKVHLDTLDKAKSKKPVAVPKGKLSPLIKINRDGQHG